MKRCPQSTQLQKVRAHTSPFTQWANFYLLRSLYRCRIEVLSRFG